MGGEIEVIPVTFDTADELNLDGPLDAARRRES